MRFVVNSFDCFEISNRKHFERLLLICMKVKVHFTMSFAHCCGKSPRLQAFLSTNPFNRVCNSSAKNSVTENLCKSAQFFERTRVDRSIKKYSIPTHDL